MNSRDDARRDEMLVDEYAALAKDYSVTASTVPGAEDFPSHYAFKALTALSGTRFCRRCGGEGSMTYYSHVEHGVCFKCNGAGTIKFGIDIPSLKGILNDKPEKFVKKVASIIRAEVNAAAKLQAKWEAKHAARKAARDARVVEVMKNLPADVVEEFTTEMQRILGVLKDYRSHADEDGRVELDDHEYLNMSGFLRSVFEQYSDWGVSEKQVVALVESLRRERNRKEKIKAAIAYVENHTYENVTATVTKMDKVSVEITNWITSTVWKVTMVGPNEERFIVKTNANRLVEAFENSLNDKTPITFSAMVKWVAPEGFPVLFTSKKFRIAK